MPAPERPSEIRPVPANSIIPTLFIGLGGTGARIVDRIATRSALLPQWESHLKPLTAFVVIDTNVLDQRLLSDNIPPRNRINIAAFDRQRALDDYRQANDRQASEWIPMDYRPREGGRPGAGQIRIESRLGFFHQSGDIRAHLDSIVRDCLDSRWNHLKVQMRGGAQNPVNVYIFNSLAGGTGSGNFLSMAYLVREVVASHQHEPRIIGNLLLSTMLTHVVEEALWDNIHANSYAALKELEHLTKLSAVRTERGKEAFQYKRLLGNTNELLSVDRSPFFLAFLYDSPGRNSLSNHEGAIGDAAFLQYLSPIMGAVEGEFDNYETHVIGLTQIPGKPVGKGYTRFFGAMGAAVLGVNAEELLEYCALRFAAQGIRQQITFGVDQGTRADDKRRERLAQHAIDYTDKKFVNMDVFQRNRVINTAFVRSVRELAAMDEEDDQPTSYWATLVDRVDLGPRVVGPTGVTTLDDKGIPLRGPSLLQVLARRMEEDRERELARVMIPTPGFTFSRETVSQYDTAADRLSTDTRRARTQVDEITGPLAGRAGTGAYVDSLGLDPIQERYFVLRLQAICEGEWLPAIERRLGEAEPRQAESVAMQKVLREELKERLKEASEVKRLFMFPDIEHFNAVREEVYGEFAALGRATEAYHRTRVERAQLQALANWLNGRAEQYARLSERMDRLVMELESRAERRRLGQDWSAPPYTMQVEALQRMEAAVAGQDRERIWHLAYQRLFIEKGRFVTTFPRDRLAHTIKEQLRPEVRPDGRTEARSLEKIEEGIRAAMVDLGRELLRPTFYGSTDSQGRPPLDVMAALELEAELVLGVDKERSSSDVADYVIRKIRALGSLVGVFGRVQMGNAAGGDGVVKNRTRRLLLGRDGLGRGPGDRLTPLLRQEMGLDGRRLEIMDGQSASTDIHRVVVHEVEMGIPIYYWRSALDSMEGSYLKLQNLPNRTFHLHTDVAWEKALPNLNPDRADLEIDWSIQTLARALVTQSVVEEGGRYYFRSEKISAGLRADLGEGLGAAQYRLEALYRQPRMGDTLTDVVLAEERVLGAGELQRRREILLAHFRTHVQKLIFARDGLLASEIPYRELQRKVLERPVYEALIRALEKLNPIAETPECRPLSDGLPQF